VPASYEQLPDLAGGLDAIAVVVLDPDLGPRDRDPHRSHPRLELRRRQVADALALGLAVHAEQVRGGQQVAQPFDRRHGEPRPRVGQRPQVRQVAVAEALEGDQHLEQGRDPGQEGDPL
jgi:hypothetical protein